MDDRNNKIRVLQVVPKMFAAGIETFVMNIYRNIDKDKVQFDFLVHSKKREFFDDEIEKMGGKIYRLSFKDDKNIFKYIKDLNRFFSTNKYEIVHGEMQSMMPLYLKISKNHNVPVRIAHSHNSDYEKSIKGFILHLFSRFSKKYANVYYACSVNSGNYLFQNKESYIVHNAIDTSKFNFDSSIREKVRNEMQINDKFVIGHIGRFDYQKNHDFLIDVFYDITKKRSDAILLLVGTGKLMNKICKKVKKLGIEDKVRFLGVRKDVNKLYQAMDCFVLPSLYEGLPIVGVEAQMTGIKCVFSNKITNEVVINSCNVKFLPINSFKEWSNYISKIDNTYPRKKIYSKEYDLKVEAKKLEKKYFELVRDLKK